MDARRGHVHLLGLFFIGLILLTLWLISSWNERLTNLEFGYSELKKKVERLELEAKLR